MPVYEYECARCEEVTEALRPMADADAAITCQHCGDKNMTRKHSVFMTGTTSAGSDSAGPALGRAGGCGGGACGCHH